MNKLKYNLIFGLFHILLWFKVKIPLVIERSDNLATGSSIWILYWKTDAKRIKLLKSELSELEILDL